jgi:hypothetical protein
MTTNTTDTTDTRIEVIVDEHLTVRATEGHSVGQRAR